MVHGLQRSDAARLWGACGTPRGPAAFSPRVGEGLILGSVKYDLVGRRCVVTGASSGIGKEIARNLAYFGATVVMACRNLDRGSAALEEIVHDSGNDHVSLLLVDLSVQSSVRAFQRQITSGGPVHVLVNNAAVMPAERSETPDGRELTWATNTLAPFLLTNLLLPHMIRSAPARVVNVASTAAGELDLGDLEFHRRPFSGQAAHAQSKQANRMLSWGLARRLGTEVSVHVCHPGMAPTGLYRAQTGWGAKMRGFGAKLMRTVGGAALTPTWAAADPDLHGQSGQFWVDRKAARCRFRDEEPIAALWERCVEMTHSDFRTGNPPPRGAGIPDAQQ